MTFVVERVELSNIRHHKHFVFEPDRSGITAISGLNGTGKSTIIDSIAWALFGTKPSGVGRIASLLREGTDLKKEPCFVKVFLEVEHGNLIVERKMVTAAGAVECTVWEKKRGGKDFDHVSGPAVSHTEPVIRKLLQMDERGFLSAVFVQQKQVDQLITATPKERGQVIEKLTGISSISAGIDGARQNYNELKKSIQQNDFDETTLSSLRSEEEKVRQQFSGVKEKYDELSLRVDDAHKVVQSAREKLQNLEKVEESAAKIREKIVAVDARIASKEEELHSAYSQKKSMKGKLAKSGGAGDVEKIANNLDRLRKEQKKQQEEFYRVSSRIDSDKEMIAAAESLVEQSTVKDLETVELKSEAMVLKRDNSERNVTKLRNAIAGKKERVTSYLKALEIIEGEDHTCPTCLQSVDDVEKAAGGLRDLLSETERSITEDEKNVKKFQNFVDFCEEGLKKFEKLREALNVLEQYSSLIVEQEKKKTVIAGEVAAREKEIAALEKIYTDARFSQELQEEYDRISRFVVTLSDEIEKLRKEASVLREEQKSLGTVSASDVAKARKQYTDANDRYHALFAECGEKREAMQVLETKLEFYGEKIAAAEESEHRYRKLLESVEIAQNSVDVLEEFRKKRVKEAIPLVSHYASTLLNRFTDGKFSEMRLDEKFNAYVVLRDGKSRPVGLLSGGEFSVVALALRIAISMLLNAGNSENALILDEVLVSQDSERSEAILNTIKEVCEGQVIMISHGDTTAAVADKVIELS